MTISVIVPAHNGGEGFRRCLAGIDALVPPPAEVIVVPDGESDGSWRYAESIGATILDPGDRAYGPAYARNRGAAAASGDLLFFLDADVVVHPDALAEVAAAFAEDPDTDAVIGSYDDAPGAPSFLSQYRNLLHHYTHQTAAEEASTFWGACGAIRREAFAAVGGFDAERFPLPSVEDIDLGYRLKAAGYTIRLRKTLLVKHLKHWGARSVIRTDFAQRGIPWTRLLLEYDRVENNLNLRAESRASVVAAFVLAAALVGVWVVPALGLVALAAAGVLLVLNAPLYRFFWRKRGLAFALGVIPWHWLYFLYGGAAFGVGALRHVLGDRPSPSSVPTTG